MARPVSPRIWLLLLLALLVGGSCGKALQNHYAREVSTRVYIVRHAEKDLTPGLPDPPLTPAGQQRARDLRTALRGGYWLSAIFSTPTARTRSTAQPLADTTHLSIQPYDARQLPALAARIRREFRGKQVLVVGHSNTILETVEALGAVRPVPTIGDNEYNYLLEVVIPQDSLIKPTATARRYGAPTP